MPATIWTQFLYGRQEDRSKGLIQLAKDRYMYYTDKDYTNCREIDLIAHIVARAGADWQVEGKREEAIAYFESAVFKNHARLLTFNHRHLYAVIQRVWREWCNDKMRGLNE